MFKLFQPTELDDRIWSISIDTKNNYFSSVPEILIMFLDITSFFNSFWNIFRFLIKFLYLVWSLISDWLSCSFFIVLYYIRLCIWHEKCEKCAQESTPFCTYCLTSRSACQDGSAETYINDERCYIIKKCERDFDNFLGFLHYLSIYKHCLLIQKFCNKLWDIIDDIFANFSTISLPSLSTLSKDSIWF